MVAITHACKESFLYICSDFHDPTHDLRLGALQMLTIFISQEIGLKDIPTKVSIG